MKLYKIFFLLAGISPVFIGCNDDNYRELNKSNTPLELSASETSLELDASNPQVEALRLTWTTGSNQGTNAGISYTFCLDIQGKHFTGGITEELGREVYEKTYTHEELNDLLLEEFGISPLSEVTLESRVTATVASGQVQPEVSNIQPITIRTHRPISKTLYLIGDATPNGWSAGAATEMRAVTNTPKAFTWTGNLTTGHFKFITTLGEFTPSYNKGESDNKLYYRESDEDLYDEPFEITEAGTYTIQANLITMAVSIARGEGPEYSELWFAGNATDWDFEPMTVDPLDPFVFHYNADLSAGGEFKIGTAENWDAVFFHPVADQTPEGTGLAVDKWAGDPDYKWNISGGIYKITLDTRDMKIDIVPFTPYNMVYMVGDATPQGWDIGGATALTVTSDPFVFTWTGTLNAGELKFTLDKQEDWNGAWFLADQPDKAPTGETENMIYNYPGAGVDYKWKIPSTATYSIELDQLKETIRIQKQ